MQTRNAFVYNGKVLLAGQFVLLASDDKSKVLDVAARAPWVNPHASFLGQWYTVAPNGRLRPVTL